MNPPALIALNTLAWPVIHLTFAWLGTRMPTTWFEADPGCVRPHRIERTAWFYERVLRIKVWKDRLPDGAGWFQGGFPKKQLARADTAYLQRFAAETCRGECIHWCVFLSAGVFFGWNSALVGWIMVGYATAANLPCILVQRYNRLRLHRILAKRSASRRATQIEAYERPVG